MRTLLLKSYFIIVLGSAPSWTFFLPMAEPSEFSSSPPKPADGQRLCAPSPVPLSPSIDALPYAFSSPKTIDFFI